MSSRKSQSLDEGGSNYSARRLSTPESKNMDDKGGGGEDGLGGSLQQRYSIPRFVSKAYYRLGLLCASHPRVVLILTFIVILWSCFPLFSLPLYSTRPQIYLQPLNNFVREDKQKTHLSEGPSSKQEHSHNTGPGIILLM